MERNKGLYISIFIIFICCGLAVLCFSKQKIDFDAVLIIEQKEKQIDGSIYIRNIDKYLLRQLKCNVELNSINGKERNIPINGRVFDMTEYYTMSFLVYSENLNKYIPCQLFFDETFENIVFVTEICEIIAANDDFYSMIKENTLP